MPATTDALKTASGVGQKMTNGMYPRGPACLNHGAGQRKQTWAVAEEASRMERSRPLRAPANVASKHLLKRVSEPLSYLHAVHVANDAREGQQLDYIVPYWLSSFRLFVVFLNHNQ
jgi:hypothetical protein